MFKIFLKKLKNFWNDDELVLDNIEFYPSKEVGDHPFFNVNKFIHISRHYFCDITNMGEFWAHKIKEGEKVIFSAKLNLSAERKRFQNVKNILQRLKL